MRDSAPLRPWVIRIGRPLEPYQSLLTAVALLAMGVFELGAFLNWNLMGLDARKSHGVAIATGLLWFIFISPHWRKEAPPARSESLATPNKSLERSRDR